jgi:hypothetical protein
MKIAIWFCHVRLAISVYPCGLYTFLHPQIRHPWTNWKAMSTSATFRFHAGARLHVREWERERDNSFLSIKTMLLQFQKISITQPLWSRWNGSKPSQDETNCDWSHRHENSIDRPPSASPNVQTVFHLNWFSALPSYEGRAAVEGSNRISVSGHHNIKDGAVFCTWNKRFVQQFFLFLFLKFNL